MTRRQFGSYLFAHNPRRIELSFQRSLVSHLIPARGARTQDLGPRCRVVRCEGEVFDTTPDGAAEKLAEIAQACAGGEAETLYLPTGERFSAVVSRFGYTAQGDGKVLSYFLEFLEAETGESA